MKRSNYLSFTFLAIAISVLIAPNVFAAETPTAATAYAIATTDATAVETAIANANATVGYVTLSFGASTKPSKAVQATLAYKISLATQSAASASQSADNKAANEQNQVLAAAALTKAASSYATLATIICVPNSTCSPESQSASQSALDASTAFTSVAAAASTWATGTDKQTKFYRSEALRKC